MSRRRWVDPVRVMLPSLWAALGGMPKKNEFKYFPYGARKVAYLFRADAASTSASVAIPGWDQPPQHSARV